MVAPARMVSLRIKAKPQSLRNCGWRTNCRGIFWSLAEGGAEKSKVSCDLSSPERLSHNGHVSIFRGITQRILRFYPSSKLYLTKRYGITPSMSRRGNCYDNAIAENFFSILKAECIYRQKIATFRQAKVLIDDFIYFTIMSVFS